MIERVDLPDEIVGPDDRMRCNAWICFTCGETTISHECGEIIFETLAADGFSADGSRAMMAGPSLAPKRCSSPGDVADHVGGALLTFRSLAERQS